MLASFTSILTLVAILLAAYGVGRPLVRAWRLEMEDRCALAVWSVSLGLIVVGVLWMGLGCVGLLYLELIAVFTVAAASWGIGEIVQASIHRRTCPVLREKVMDELGPQASRIWLKLFGACCLIALLASLTSAVAPPTAGDALCYHLELPKRFLQEHRLAYLPDHENSTFPLLVEMWYLWALALDGGVTAQLMHWALGGLLALAAVLLARSVVGRDWAWFAGGIVLLAPGVTNQMTAPLNDVGLAVFTTLAVAAWWRAAIDDDGPHWYLSAGLMLGGAIGVKYLALLFAAALFTTWFGLAWRDRERTKSWLRGAAIMVVLASAVAGPWYARAAYYRGNPVYPFFQSALDESAAPTIRESKLPLGRTPWGLLAAPWAVTMHAEDFGGRGHQLGAAFLALLPGLLIARR
ncbi:MAG: phospholipid carrier-dependent glycosyltransferase, partial [Planctomycetia bacterium]|nr:phospholipid carrier-dependent glycosyltransferase [Planctomycetia bacterium]